MLQRLKLADQFAELLAFLQIGDGAPEYLLAEADHFRRHRAAPDIQHALEQVCTLIDLAQHAVGSHLDVVEGDACRVMRIDHRGAFDGDALALRIDQKQRQSVAFAGAASAARRDNQQIGNMTVNHEGLGPDQPESVTGADGLQADLQRPMLRMFVHRQRGEQRAIGDLRQIRRLLCRIATAQQRRRAEHRRGEER